MAAQRSSLLLFAPRQVPKVGAAFGEPHRSLKELKVVSLAGPCVWLRAPASLYTQMAHSIPSLNFSGGSGSE